ncbi:MAG: hypothetical protein WCT03_26905, partial [Candidatus Obscuribacterales bacterium]
APNGICNYAATREPGLTKDRANDSDDKAKKAEAPSTSDRVSESSVVDSGDKARRLRAQLNSC